MESFRNKFVVKRESGHPGYASTTIYASREDLAALAQEIDAKLKGDGYRPPFISHYATEAHGRSSRVYLQIEPATQVQMEAFHRSENRLWDYLLRPLLGLMAVAFCVIGAVQVWMTVAEWIGAR